MVLKPWNGVLRLFSVRHQQSHKRQVSSSEVCLTPHVRVAFLDGAPDTGVVPLLSIPYGGPYNNKFKSSRRSVPQRDQKRHDCYHTREAELRRFRDTLEEAWAHVRWQESRFRQYSCPRWRSRHDRKEAHNCE